MIHPKTTGLLGLLAVGLLLIFASTEADTDRRLLSLQTPISCTKTADDPQPGKSPLPGNLRWVRGSVLSWASDSLTLQLKKGSLTLDLSVSAQIIHGVKGTQKVISADQLKDEGTGPDNEAKPDSLAVGSQVQAHYVERHHKSYAILIIEETDSAPQSLKESGSSYLGVFVKAEFGAIHLRVNGRIRWLYPFYGTTFVDSTGHRLPARELKAGDTLLITYRIDSDSFGAAGDVTQSTKTTALEIRRLTLR
jgi:hypothetical protein